MHPGQTKNIELNLLPAPWDHFWDMFNKNLEKRSYKKNCDLKNSGVVEKSGQMLKIRRDVYQISRQNEQTGGYLKRLRTTLPRGVKLVRHSKTLRRWFHLETKTPLVRSQFIILILKRFSSKYRANRISRHFERSFHNSNIYFCFNYQVHVAESFVQ